jgi:allantoin racemase
MIVLINPNSTVSMTEAMLRTARNAVPDAYFEGWTSRYGPPAIEGREDGDAATPHLLKLVRKASDAGAKVIVIGCFDDTGLDEARRIAACPVIGIGQAAYHMAALAGARFSVVTTLAVSVPVLEENVKSCGLGGNLVRVRASDVSVLDLELDADHGRYRRTGPVENWNSPDRRRPRRGTCREVSMSTDSIEAAKKIVRTTLNARWFPIRTGRRPMLPGTSGWSSPAAGGFPDRRKRRNSRQGATIGSGRSSCAPMPHWIRRPVTYMCIMPVTSTANGRTAPRAGLAEAPL